jgi:hypothetical protein
MAWLLALPIFGMAYIGEVFLQAFISPLLVLGVGKVFRPTQQNDIRTMVTLTAIMVVSVCVPACPAVFDTPAATKSKSDNPVCQLEESEGDSEHRI